MRGTKGKRRAAMNFRQFEALYWIGRLGSFHAAARHLKTSQPTISARIREMEADYGIVIFDRSERQVRTTPKGAMLMEQAVRVMQLDADVRASLLAPEGTLGRVRLGTTAVSGLTWVRSVIERLEAEHPGLVIELAVDSSNALQVQLERGQLDVAVIAGPLTSARLSGEHLTEVEMGWLASPALGLPEGVLAATDLAPRAIISDKTGTPMHRAALDWFRAEGVEPRRHHTCSHVVARLQLAAAGFGIAMAASSAATGALREGTLVRLATARPLPTLEYLVATGGQIVASHVQLVIEAIKAQVSGPAGFDAYYARVGEVATDQES